MSRIITNRRRRTCGAEAEKKQEETHTKQQAATQRENRWSEQQLLHSSTQKIEGRYGRETRSDGGAKRALVTPSSIARLRLILMRMRLHTRAVFDCCIMQCWNA